MLSHKPFIEVFKSPWAKLPLISRRVLVKGSGGKFCVINIIHFTAASLSIQPNGFGLITVIKKIMLVTTYWF